MTKGRYTKTRKVGIGLPSGVVPPTDENRLNEDVLKWSGEWPIPVVGESVYIHLNSLGPAVVTGYAISGGWVALLTAIKNPPDWYIRQNPSNDFGWVFGAECSRIKDSPTDSSPSLFKNYLADALYNTSNGARPQPEYARGIVVGIVSALMSLDYGFNAALRIVALELPDDFLEEAIPAEWLKRVREIIKTREPHEKIW